VDVVELVKVSSSGHLRAQVIFLKPPGKEDSRVHTDLWRAASELPGTVVISDLYGRVADLFHAVVSGETMVYDAAGNLVKFQQRYQMRNRNYLDGLNPAL
jgi:hypothetical protein